jgi:hypothetical protein
MNHGTKKLKLGEKYMMARLLRLLRFSLVLVKKYCTRVVMKDNTGMQIDTATTTFHDSKTDPIYISES